MKRPFVGVGISFVLGVIISYYLKIDMAISLVLFFLVFLIYCFYLYKERDRSYLILVLFMIMGISITSYKAGSSVLIDNVDISLNVGAIIDKIVYKNESEEKYIVKVNSIETNGNEKFINEKTVLKVYGNKNLEIGDNINFRGVFRLPMENTNPKLFNYRKSLLSNNIFTTINIKPSSIYDVREANKSFKYRSRISFRNRVEETFDKYLGETNSDLIKGIVLGDYTYLDQEDLKTYRDIGLAHILAVSGLHIGIIAGSVVFFLSRIGIKRKWNIFFTISMIWVYGYAIGFPVSILRANIMFSLLFIAGAIAEPYDSINALFLSFWILLIFNPLSILGVGFQLSYAATFSILYFSPKIKSWFYPYENKFIYTISGLLGLYIGILPIQIYYFNRFSLISIISNILVSPIIFLALILSGILLAVDFLFPSLGVLVGFIIDISLNIQNAIVKTIYKNNFLNLKLASPSIFEIILYYFFIFTLFEAFDFSRLKINVKNSIYYYLIAVVICISGFQITDETLEINFIDVGQGDSSLIRTRSGNYLVDTGGNLFDGFDIGENITLPYLEKHGINRLKGVFITHYHLDHCKGIPILMENIDIDNIFISYRNPESEIYNYIMDGDIPVVLLEDGDSFKLDKNTVVNVLSPSSVSRDRGYSENNLSLVFDLSYHHRDILFTGDIEKEMERVIEDKIKHVDILKVAHHGSHSSSTDRFLSKSSPDIAVVSVGKGNIHGHPDREVIDRFNVLNTDVYRTDEVGMTKVILDNEKLDIMPFLSNKAKDYYLMKLLFLLIYYLISYIVIKIYIVLESELKRIEIQ